MKNTWETSLPQRPCVSSRHRAIKRLAEVSFPAPHQECSAGSHYSQEDGWPGWAAPGHRSGSPRSLKAGAAEGNCAGAWGTD